MYHHKKIRCLRCKLHEELCICSEIPILSTSTRLLLIMHSQEVEKPSNTGKLAHFALPNSEIRIRGEKGKPLSLEGIEREDYHSLLLYPDANSIELNEAYLAERKDKPIQLIVPDGTWGQARRTGSKISAAFPQIPHVKVPFTGLSKYRLRKETNPEGLATFEAIARAYGILENKKIQEELERIFLVTVERLLYTRGKLAAEEVFGGIPAAALVKR